MTIFFSHGKKIYIIFVPKNHIRMSTIQEFQNEEFKNTSFEELMEKRVYNVLLIATNYDAFMLEGDGRVNEQIFIEYTSLSLRYPPRFTHVTTKEKAIKKLKEKDIDYRLIIFMPNMVDRDVFRVPKEIKEEIENLYPSIPIVVLTPFSKEVSKSIAKQDLSAIDYVFSWLGNAELLLAIIKLIEDKWNAKNDTKKGVQIILLVEDSIRFYSAALPHLYQIVLKQSQEFAKEALNEHEKTLRMRGRPKIKLARTYEEALRIYNSYKDNILGIVTDMSFLRNNEKDPLAGYHFCREVLKDGDPVPIIMESSNTDNERYAKELKVSFIYKHSRTYPQDLRKQVMERFGFGDFVIRNPDTKEEIMRIKDLKGLQQNVFNIPDDSLLYHLKNNHFSRFFYSRAMFPPAQRLKKKPYYAFKDMNEARQFIFDAIVEYRKMKNYGVVAVYQKERFDAFSNIARIGEGSLGGKGRGLAFIGDMAKRQHLSLGYPNFPVSIPKTLILCTDIFDEFIETNNLYAIALGDLEDREILDHFLQAELPERLNDDLTAFFEVVKSPIAVRSSSLLEDAHYQPFAGVYSTYMIPDSFDAAEMLRAVLQAIKGVYASVFFKDSKAYMIATRNLIESEKMAIVIQEVIGRKYDDHLYPTISGVAKSLNFYPIGNEKAEDGIANIALGLGKYVVDGGVTLRFSPRHPANILQMSTVDFALRETQTHFLALDMKDAPLVLDENDSFNLVKLSLKDADKDGVLKSITSTYDPQDMVIRDGYYPGGRKILSFSGILQYETVPLCNTLNNLLKIGQEEMGRPIEIEFAVDLNPNCRTEGAFYMLQIRPIVDMNEIIEENLLDIHPENTILFSKNVLGHGIINDVYDMLYVKTKSFNSSNNQLIAYEIERINRQFTEKEQGFILAGPGRWGSSDHWLGIPVKWPHISNARAIVEYSLTNYHIDPSQGTHFFQNLTSNGVGYFTVNPAKGDLFDEQFLNSHPAVYETDFLRLVHFESPVLIKMDGKKSIGVALKPNH